jgi:hypothetical protein
VAALLRAADRAQVEALLRAAARLLEELLLEVLRLQGAPREGVVETLPAPGALHQEEQRRQVASVAIQREPLAQRALQLAARQGS